MNKKVDKSRQKKMWYKALYTYITAQQSTYNKISSEWQVYRGDVSNFRWKEGGIELECIKPRIAKPLDSRLNTKHMTLLKDVHTYFFSKICLLTFFGTTRQECHYRKMGMICSTYKNVWFLTKVLVLWYLSNHHTYLGLFSKSCKFNVTESSSSFIYLFGIIANTNGLS